MLCEKRKNELIYPLFFSFTEDVTFSRVTEDKWRELLLGLGISIVVEENPVVAINNAAIPTPPHYAWDPVVDEPKHEENFKVKGNDGIEHEVVGYRPWLQMHLNLPESAQFVSTKSMKNLLRLDGLDLSFVAHGTTDLILLHKNYADNSAMYGLFALILFEIKKPVALGQSPPASWDIQACLELLSAAKVGQWRPVVILTDLCAVWRIYWLEKGDSLLIKKRNASFAEVATMVKIFIDYYSKPNVLEMEVSKRIPDDIPDLPTMKRARLDVKKSDDVALLDDILSPEELHRAKIMEAMQQFRAYFSQELIPRPAPEPDAYRSMYG